MGCEPGIALGAVGLWLEPRTCVLSLCSALILPPDGGNTRHPRYACSECSRTNVRTGSHGEQHVVPPSSRALAIRARACPPRLCAPDCRLGRSSRIRLDRYGLHTRLHASLGNRRVSAQVELGCHRSADILHGLDCCRMDRRAGAGLPCRAHSACSVERRRPRIRSSSRYASGLVQRQRWLAAILGRPALDKSRQPDRAALTISRGLRL